MRPSANGTTVAQLFARFAGEVNAGLILFRIHQGDHADIAAAAVAASQRVAELATEVDEDPLRIMVADDLLLYRDRPLIGASLVGHALIRALHEWNLGGLEVGRAATPTDMRNLFELARRRPQATVDHHEVNAKLQRAGCRALRCVPPPFHGHRHPQWFALLAERAHALQGTHRLMQDVTVAAARGAKLPLAAVDEAAATLVALDETDIGPLVALGRAEHVADPFDHGHSVRTALLALDFARSLTQDTTLLQRVVAAALLHDVGRNLLPLALLQRGPADHDERRQLDSHAALGARYLLDHDDVDPLIVVTAFGHHVGDSGRGYPETRHGHELSHVVEIVKLCDAYEELTAGGPSQPAVSPTRALRAMIAMRGHFNLPLLRRFIESTGFFPRGQLLRMGSGEVLRVVEQGGDPATPIARVARRTPDSPLFEPNARRIDLAKLDPHMRWAPLDSTLDELLLRSTR